ncbi:hypothetical protein P3S67_014575 [Capsicum chacoense]
MIIRLPNMTRSIVDVSKKVEQPHTLNDPAFQEDDSQIHEIEINENEILNTLNDPDGMLIDMDEEEEEKEGNGREEDKNDEDGDGDDDDEDDDDDDDDDEEEEEEECELHKNKRRKI